MLFHYGTDTIAVTGDEYALPEQLGHISVYSISQSPELGILNWNGRSLYDGYVVTYVNAEAEYAALYPIRKEEPNPIVVVLVDTVGMLARNCSCC